MLTQPFHSHFMKHVGKNLASDSSLPDGKMQESYAFYCAVKQGHTKNRLLGPKVMAKIRSCWVCDSCFSPEVIALIWTKKDLSRCCVFFTFCFLQGGCRAARYSPPKVGRDFREKTAFVLNEAFKTKWQVLPKSGCFAFSLTSGLCFSPTCRCKLGKMRMMSSCWSCFLIRRMLYPCLLYTGTLPVHPSLTRESLVR